MELLATVVLVAIAWGIHAVCGRLARGLVRAGLELAILASLAAMSVWLVGFAATWPSDWSDPCGERGDIVAISKKDHLFPPSSVCTWTDGLREQRVPSWVNPALAASLAATGVGAAVAVGARAAGATRRRRSPSHV